MENKGKKKGLIVGIVIIAIIAVLAIVYFSVNQKSDTTPVVNNNQEDCTEGCELKEDTTPVSKTNRFNITYSGETVTYNAYDFIIEKMSQAQYWTYDQYNPLYRLHKNYYQVSKEEPIINGTGWILYDENTASFVRGCQGRLIINFSNNTANSDRSFYSDSWDVDESNILDPINEIDNVDNQVVVNYYFNNNQYEELAYASDTEPTTFDVLLEEYQMVNDTYWEIYRTIQFYNDVFDELGIPLLNQPEGTLTKYKNKTIKVPVELVDLKYSERWGDGLINSPFDERVGWDWYWEEDSDNVWISDYRDVLNMQFPESSENEMHPLSYNDVDYQVSKYAPIFLCLADKSVSKHYAEAEGYGFTEYYNFGGAVVTYYLKPLYKELFGFNGVYFCEENTLSTGGNYIDRLMTSEEFNSGISVLSDLSYLLSIHDKGDFVVYEEMEMSSTGGGLEEFNDYINELLEHYNVENIYGKDFLQYLMLLYDTSAQKELGLR